MLIPNINLNQKTILVTGAAGFIGANLVMQLLKECQGVQVVGIDNVNDYYDVSFSLTIKDNNKKDVYQISTAVSDGTIAALALKKDIVLKHIIILRDIGFSLCLFLC